MAYGRNEWQLDWLKMNQPQSWYEVWLQSEDGFWDSPGVNSTLSQRVNNHGAVISPVWKTERSITLEGKAYARNDGDIKTLALGIKSLCSDPYKLYRLSTKTEIGEFETEVKLDGPILVDSGQDLHSSINFSIQLVAPEPRIYHTAWQTMTTGLAQDLDDGLDFSDPGLDFSDPGLSFGESEGSTGFLRLTNNGTAPAPVEFTLYGPLDHPTITTTVDGQAYTMKYNGELLEGEYVVIKPEETSVLLQGTTSRRHLLNPADFRGFSIPPMPNLTTREPGVLTVGLTHEGPPSATGRIRARWRSAIW